MPNDTAVTFEALFDQVQNEAVSAFNNVQTGVMDTARTVIIHQMRQIATAVWDVIDGLAITPRKGRRNCSTWRAARQPRRFPG